jgi:hypothetical protein
MNDWVTQDDSIRVMATEYLAEYVLHAPNDALLWKHGFFITYRVSFFFFVEIVTK